MQERSNAPRIYTGAAAEKKLAEMKKQQPVNVHELVTVRSFAQLQKDFNVMRTAHRMAINGQERATAKEIAEQALRIDDYFLEPYEVGQVCSAYGIRAVTSHGKSRFVLEPLFMEMAAERISQAIEGMKPQMDEALAKFESLAATVDDLQQRVNRASALLQQAQQLSAYIERTRGITDRVRRLEQTAADLQQESKRAEQIEAYIAKTQERIKGFGKLNQRKAKADERLAALAAQQKSLDGQEQDIAKREQEQAARLRKLQDRHRWVTAAELDAAIEQAKADLDQVREQLGEKKGLLSRLRGGNR